MSLSRGVAKKLNNKQLKQFIAGFTIVLIAIGLICYSQLSVDSSMHSVKQLVCGLAPVLIGVGWGCYVIVKNNVKPIGDTIIKLKVAMIMAVIIIALQVILSFILGTKI